MSTAASATVVPSRPGMALGSPSVVLFLTMFASQAGVLVLAPVLSEVSGDFDVSIAEAGQLRIVAAPLAAVVALMAGRALVRWSPRAVLAAGAGLLGVGSLASAAAPTFPLLALAQVPLWAGIALLLTAGIAATAAWSEPGRRSAVVAHAFAGPPSAWIVGMPVIGLAAEVHWRLAFVVLPLPAALLAALALARRGGDVPIGGRDRSAGRLLEDRAVRRWALGELCANAAWAGTLVFSGALFTEVCGLSAAATGLVLALVAGAYLAGNKWAGRADPTRARRAMIRGSLVAALALACTWAFTPAVAVTLALFAIAAFMAAARTVAGTVYGFTVSGDRAGEVGALRAATTQLGYLIGSVAGGLALATGGFAALAVAFGGLLLASTLPHAGLSVRRLSRLAFAGTR